MAGQEVTIDRIPKIGLSFSREYDDKAETWLTKRKVSLSVDLTEAAANELKDMIDLGSDYEITIRCKSHQSLLFEAPVGARS